MRKNNYSDWDDHLFKNRNKSYGAYDMRKSEGKNLLKSLIVSLAFFGISLTILSFKNKNIVNETKASIGKIIYTISTVDEPISKKIEPAKPASLAAVVEATTNRISIIPEPTVIDAKMEEDFTIGVVPSLLEKSEKVTVLNSSLIKGNENGNSEGNGQNDGNLESGDSENGIRQIKITPPILPSTLLKIEKTFTPRDVKEMVIYPGCEKVGSLKKERENCMSKALNQELANQLSDFQDIMRKENLDSAKAKLNFVVNKYGEIVNVFAVNGGNQELGIESKIALEKISKKLLNKGKRIKPAELEDGTQVSVIFSLPIYYVSNGD